MATDIRDEAALRAMEALITADPGKDYYLIAEEAFEHAEAFIEVRKKQADKRMDERQAAHAAEIARGRA